MVETTEYIRPENVNAVVLHEEGPVCVIVGEGGFEDGKTKEGEDYSKLFVEVQFPSGHMYKLRLSKGTAVQMGAELGSTNTSKWVGTRLKLTPKENGNFKWVEPTIIPTAPSNEPIIPIKKRGSNSNGGV